jgi:hypothetical protein
MAKAFLTCILLATVMQLAKAQGTILTGTVKNEQGKPLHFVFVQDNQLKTAMYTDSLGNFSISTNPNSVLEFDRMGYTAMSMNIGNNMNIQIVLKSNGSNSNTNAISTAAIDNTNDNSMRVSLAHKKEQVHGNKFLFDDFVNGFVINQSSQLVHNPAYLYDYDKMEGALLFTDNNRSVAEINRDQIKSFTLFSNNDEVWVFKIVSAIDKIHYTQILSTGKKYEIYKFTTTKFVKSNYVAAGITSHGNDYDEFVDDSTYYVFNIASNQLQPLSLKRKSLKTVFSKETDKVNKYLNDTSGSIDDSYLTRLGTFMNN